MRRADTNSPHSAANPPEVAAPLLYLYMIAEASDPLIAGLASDPVCGMDPVETLFAIRRGQLAAIISRVPGESFQEEPLNALLSDLPRLTPFVLAHDAAVAELFRRGWTVIPMRFGVVYHGGEQIAALLRDRKSRLLATFARIHGKQEWGLKLFGDRSRLQAAAEEATEELRLLAAAIDSAAPGRAYLLSRRRERLVASAADQLVRELENQVLDSLGVVSSAIHRNQIVNSDAGAPALVLNLAVLVETRAAERLHASVRELRRSSAALGGRVELSGPWAPYSFVEDGRSGT